MPEGTWGPKLRLLVSSPIRIDATLSVDVYFCPPQKGHLGTFPDIFLFKVLMNFSGSYFAIYISPFTQIEKYSITTDYFPHIILILSSLYHITTYQQIDVLRSNDSLVCNLGVLSFGTSGVAPKKYFCADELPKGRISDPGDKLFTTLP